MKASKLNPLVFFLAVSGIWAASPATAAELLNASLDGDASVSASGKEIKAALGAGATFVPSIEKQGVLPAKGQPAIAIDAPAELWRSAGTVSFFFQPSRKLTSGPQSAKGNFKTRLLDCPLFTVDLKESSSQLTLDVSLNDADEKPRNSRLNWSHLKAAQWYHLAFAWNTANGSFECFLNGSTQEQFRFKSNLKNWKAPADTKGPLIVGGTGGDGDRFAAMAIDSVQLFDETMDSEQVRQSLLKRMPKALAGEGRTEYFGKLNFHAYSLELVYSADFSQPLNVMDEASLFEDGKRARRPEGKDWVLEGPGRAWTENGSLRIESDTPAKGGHVVLWNTRKFPENCLLQFDVSPTNSDNGLNIVFFGAQSRDGNDVFDLSLPKRDGVFKNYHSGALDAYHISYWACDSDNGGTRRRTANIRKNRGFQLVSCGSDNIAGKGVGPHTVQLLKFDGRILLETANQLSAVYFDDGETYGPVLKDGQIGLRQMGHTHRASYGSFVVYKITKKPLKPKQQAAPPQSN